MEPQIPLRLQPSCGRQSSSSTLSRSRAPDDGARLLPFIEGPWGATFLEEQRSTIRSHPIPRELTLPFKGAADAVLDKSDAERLERDVRQHVSQQENPNADAEIPAPSRHRVHLRGRNHHPAVIKGKKLAHMDLTNLDLTNRRGIITGAGQGIGRALALEFGRHGGHLLLVGRQLATLTETARLVTSAGGTTEILVEDLTQPGAIERIAQTVASWSVFDLLVNNAGNVRAGRLELTSDADVHSMINLNLTAPILLTKTLLPALQQSGKGRGSILLNIASGIALVGLPFYAVYAATKSGIAQFGESLRRELIGTGVHVATVYPGATDTAMMTSQNAGAELGWARRSLDDVITDLIAALEAGKHEINTAPEDRRAIQQLNITDPMAVDAALAPSLEALEFAVRDHRSV